MVTRVQRGGILGAVRGSMTPMPPRLRLSRHLEQALWAHIDRELPNESVGVLGREQTLDTSAQGAEQSPGGVPWDLRAIYPLTNISAQPDRHYLADPAGLLRALKAMQHDHLALGAIYHSHPHGPARPSRTDLTLAAYSVPYVIADVEQRLLRAYLLPENTEVELELD